MFLTQNESKYYHAKKDEAMKEIVPKNCSKKIINLLGKAFVRGYEAGQRGRRVGEYIVGG